MFDVQNGPYHSQERERPLALMAGVSRSESLDQRPHTSGELLREASGMSGTSSRSIAQSVGLESRLRRVTSVPSDRRPLLPAAERQASGRHGTARPRAQTTRPAALDTSTEPRELMSAFPELAAMELEFQSLVASAAVNDARCAASPWCTACDAAELGHAATRPPVTDQIRVKGAKLVIHALNRRTRPT